MLSGGYSEGPIVGRAPYWGEAMAVVCSGLSYDMEVVSHGFVTDISKTDAKNEEKIHALIDEAEVPRERLAKLFEPKVLPPEAGAGIEDGGEGGDED